MAQHSNRTALVEAAIRCLQTMPPETITARVLSTEAGANLASIGYHFGSKDGLLAEAMDVAFQRWQDEVVSNIVGLPARDFGDRLEQAIDVVLAGMSRYAGLTGAFFIAVARAPHDERVRQPLAESYAKLRPAMAAAFSLGDDRAADDAAGIIMAIFDGLLVQAVLDPGQILDPQRVAAAQRRLFRSFREADTTVGSQQVDAV
ncbi:TetR/AcrR family transcriptional regulator [Nocardia sp. CA-107356]|uniref:TetR/AcrR family transcriptional regulator n=1 Tax=Nocardia sp. CA-107356 TaxID=3239972 RepID=UPI003D932587